MSHTLNNSIIFNYRHQGHSRRPQ